MRDRTGAKAWGGTIWGLTHTLILYPQTVLLPGTSYRYLDAKPVCQDWSVPRLLPSMRPHLNLTHSNGAGSVHVRFSNLKAC